MLVITKDEIYLSGALSFLSKVPYVNAKIGAYLLNNLKSDTGLLQKLLDVESDLFVIDLECFNYLYELINKGNISLTASIKSKNYILLYTNYSKQSYLRDVRIMHDKLNVVSIIPMSMNSSRFNRVILEKLVQI